MGEDAFWSTKRHEFVLEMKEDALEHRVSPGSGEVLLQFEVRLSKTGKNMSLELTAGGLLPPLDTQVFPSPGSCQARGNGG